MTFFGVDPVDLKVAETAVLLRESSKKYVGGGCSSNTNWVSTLEALRKKHGGIVLFVADWYAANMGEPFVPQAFHASSFENKYGQILLAYERSQTAVVAVCEEAQVLADAVAGEFTWPPEILGNLGKIVQVTHDRWWAFAEVLVARRDTAPQTDRAWRFLHALGHKMHTFVRNWMERLGSKYGRLQSYASSWEVLTFAPDHKMFKESFWWGWVQEWTGSPHTFDALLEELIAVWRKK